VIIRRLYTAYAWLTFLNQDDPVAQQLRPLLHEHGRFPTRRTWERRIFRKLRSQAIEPFNGLFKNIFKWRIQMPVKGLLRSQLLALGAIVVYQLVLLYQHEHHLPLGKRIKPLLRAA
jgi:hypothetical protein